MKNFDLGFIILRSEFARKPRKELSKLLKKSPQRLKYTEQELLRQNVLRSPHAIIDYAYFGQLLFKIYFKGSYIAEEDKKQIFSRLQENPFVVSIYELSGEFDLVIEMQTSNPSRFNKEFKIITTTLFSQSTYNIVLNVVTHIYPKLYLFPKLEHEFAKEIIIGGDRALEQFDSAEKRILLTLVKKPLITQTNLAQEAALHVSTTKDVLQKLQKRKIIRGFQYVIDSEQLHLFKHRLFLKLHNLTTDREKQLFDYFMDAKEVVQASKTIGNWDVEVDIESFNASSVRQFITQLRQTFKDIIATFNIMEKSDYYMKKYLATEHLMQEIQE